MMLPCVGEEAFAVIVPRIVPEARERQGKENSTVHQRSRDSSVGGPLRSAVATSAATPLTRLA